MHKQLEDIIEVSLILFYSQTYLCVAVSEQDFWRSGVGKILVLEVSVSRHFLNDTKPVKYILCDMCKHLEDIIEVALISIYSQIYLCVAVSERVFIT